MYEADSVCETPPDNAHLWRYMDVGVFLHLIKSKGLYFCRRHQLHDRWEGARSDSLEAYAKQRWCEEDSCRFQGFQAALASLAAFNCWHENENESVAMWRLYTSGKEGVTIATTVGRLKQVFADQPPEPLLIGRVRYIDYAGQDEQPDPDALSTLFRKRKSYAHESEVRILIRLPHTPVLLKKRELGQEPQLAPGVGISVDLPTLVERIVTSPGYPPWAIDALQSVVSESGLNIAIEKSDLLSKPHNNG